MRPPLVGREAPSAAAARWRFRVGAAVLLALLVLLVVLLQRRLTGADAQDPGVSAQQRPTAGAAVSGSG